MTTLEFTTRLERVFRENSPEDICRFIQTRALTHSFLGYLIMDQFGRYDTDDARATVQQCFLTPLCDRQLTASRLDWQQVDRNLAEVMRRAHDLHRQGHDRKAVDLARNVILLTYSEYRDDHPAPTRVQSSNDYHTADALQLLRDILLDGSTLPPEDRRQLLIDFITEASAIQPKDRFCTLTAFLKDAHAAVRRPKSKRK